eukprot:scaffold154581_cov42-Prasinocladus_malaysianus.AAC.1
MAVPARRNSTGSAALPRLPVAPSMDRGWQTGSPLHTPDRLRTSLIASPGSPSASDRHPNQDGQAALSPDRPTTTGMTEILISVRNDYISASLNPSVAKLLSKNGDMAVLFADLVYKVNRKGELKSKILVLTDQYMYVLDHVNYSQRLRVPIQAIDEIKLSRFDDGFFAVYHASETKDQLLVSRRRAEFANSLIEARTDSRLKAGYSAAFVQRLDANTIREVTFYLDDEQLIHTRLVTRSTLSAVRAREFSPPKFRAP